jgi:REP element-mobilizing transposase RayT
MSLYTRHDSENLPSFVTTNTKERRPIFRRQQAAELLVRTIYEVRSELSFLLLAFAVMPDHAHLIFVPPAGQLGHAVQLIKGRFARAYNLSLGRSGSVWQSRYHERTLKGDKALSSAIDYVHHNPVAARLAEEPAEFAWSSANGRYAVDLAAYSGQAEA